MSNYGQSYKFIIQRSKVGNDDNFEDIGIVNRVKNVNRYEYQDSKMLKGTAYYRIKQIDELGNESYSVIKRIDLDNTYFEPNLSFDRSTESLTIQLQGNVTRNFVFSLYNQAGQKLYECNMISEGAQENNIHLSQYITNGMYLVVLRDLKTNIGYYHKIMK